MSRLKRLWLRIKFWFIKPKSSSYYEGIRFASNLSPSFSREVKLRTLRKLVREARDTGTYTEFDRGIERYLRVEEGEE